VIIWRTSLFTRVAFPEFFTAELPLFRMDEFPLFRMDEFPLLFIEALPPVALALPPVAVEVEVAAEVAVFVIVFLTSPVTVMSPIGSDPPAKARLEVNIATTIPIAIAVIFFIVFSFSLTEIDLAKCPIYLKS
jgi:hypothetical protein